MKKKESTCLLSSNKSGSKVLKEQTKTKNPPEYL